jgi:hypothetical protein
VAVAEFKVFGLADGTIGTARDDIQNGTKRDHFEVWGKVADVRAGRLFYDNEYRKPIHDRECRADAENRDDLWAMTSAGGVDGSIRIIKKPKITLHFGLEKTTA